MDPSILSRFPSPWLDPRIAKQLQADPSDPFTQDQANSEMSPLDLMALAQGGQASQSNDSDRSPAGSKPVSDGSTQPLNQKANMPYKKDEAKTENTTTTITNEENKKPLAVDPEDLKNDAKFGFNADAFSAQESGIKDAMNQLNLLKQMPADINLAPVMALADSFNAGTQSPTELAKYYKAPSSPEDKQEMIIKLQDAINKERSQYSGAMSGLLKHLYPQNSFDATKVNNNTVTKTIQDQSQSNIPPRVLNPNAKTSGERSTDRLATAQHRLNTDQEFSNAKKGYDEAINLQKMLVEARSNPIAKSAAAISAAKAAVAGMGRLNIPELSAFGGAQGIENQLDAMVENAKSGTMTSANFKFLNNLSNIYLNHAVASKNAAADAHAKQWAINNGLPIDVARKQLTGENGTYSSPVPSQSASKVDVNKMFEKALNTPDSQPTPTPQPDPTPRSNVSPQPAMDLKSRLEKALKSITGN